jgi:predicted outer membrane repeat protein
MYNGGYMHRLFRVSFLAVAICALGFSVSKAADKPTWPISGRVAPGEVRFLTKDTVYNVDGQLVIGGTLLIEPGTTLSFGPNSRIIDSTGGRIIADGFAGATYYPNPDGINPMKALNNKGWDGYADLKYFIYPNTIVSSSPRELTVGLDKSDYIFNFILDTNTRKLTDNAAKLTGKKYAVQNNEYRVSYVQAMMYLLSGINEVKDLRNDFRNDYFWKRSGTSDTLKVKPEPINFVGQIVTGASREKGYIVVLPGARAAFFRNCNFENMRKDVTVDTNGYYSKEYATMNAKMAKLANGSGGAITSFSSRTWLLNCNFKNNVARIAGGALQLLQAPEGFPVSANENTWGFYPEGKNPNLTEPNSSASLYNKNIRRVDNIDEDRYNELTDAERQAYDDARLSVFLGRVRNLSFTNNVAKLTNVTKKLVGSIWIEQDDETVAADYPMRWGNANKGGALVIAGREGLGNQIEIGLGVNTKITVKDFAGVKDTVIVLEQDSIDNLSFMGNKTMNFQKAIASEGSLGGAIYVGANTSLIIAGEFNGNEAVAVNMDEKELADRSGLYSKGGAIYQANTYARLQVRGNAEKIKTTLFENNKAANGGAIYVDGNDDAEKSPIIGGSDALVKSRDYGYSIKFNKNEAYAEGGAIYTKRNMSINGAGGAFAGTNAGYDDEFRVVFKENKANYSGGAITIALPFVYPPMPAEKRNISFVRALFANNRVGENISNNLNKTLVRGGGAVYSEHADMNIVKAVEFNKNFVVNGNGAAIHMGNPISFSKRFFVTDLDNVKLDPATNIPADVESFDAPFIHNFENAPYRPDARMLTRFLDNEVKWDAEVMASQNGSGMTQINKGTVVTKANINAIEFVNNNEGIAVGSNGTIIKMTNGGETWSYKNLSTPYNLTSVHFVTDRIGFIAGDRGVILKTTNGGNDWTVVNNTNASYDINAMTFSNSMNGFAVGKGGFMLATTNGGDSWAQVATGTSNSINDVRFNGVSKGYAVGNRGTILVTENGGASWSVQNANTFADLNTITFTDNNTGYVAGNGAIFKTTNAGQTWTNVLNDDSKNFKSIFFTSLDKGTAVGAYGVMVKTANAGQTWENVDVKLNENKVYYSFSDIFYPSENTVLLSANNGLMLRSTDAGANWKEVLPSDKANVDVKRYHPSLGIRENGIGLGGAIYIVDSVTTRDSQRDDLVRFNRVRFEGNIAYSGAAVYSDNYGLKLAATRSLAVKNVAKSEIGKAQNAIHGPAIDVNNDNVIDANFASSDLAGAIFYGELVGPEPYANSSWAANSFYDNDARFLVRVPDYPNSKGILSGSGLGESGVDTLRGNYWGRTEADVTYKISNGKEENALMRMETFFVDKCDSNYLTYVYGQEGTDNLLQQGPFERNGTFATENRIDETIKQFNYNAIPLVNGVNENTVGPNSIPEKYLFSGRIYDLYDKGTDIKVVDYANRRMSPIEDFAVGIPEMIKTLDKPLHPNKKSYMTRWIRDPYVAELEDNGKLVYPMIAAMQSEWMPDANGEFYQPIGYPLFLEMQADYRSSDPKSNVDERFLNETVAFVINETTGDFIRTNMKQVSETGSGYNKFRSRVELVPDLSKRNQHTSIRRVAEKLLSLGTGDVLLFALKSNPENEDAAALKGRKYYGYKTQMGGSTFAGITLGIDDLYLNRDNWPISNNGTATYFAGEKYQALPVDTGDVVRVISRTALWSQGVVKSFAEGISFKITSSTMPPTFTGNIIKMQQDTVVKLIKDKVTGKTIEQRQLEYLNFISLTEDRSYPGRYGNMGNASGRDSILAITAIDRNHFYDPRAQSDSTADFYSKIDYSIEIPANSGLEKWLRYTLVPAGKSDNVNEFNQAQGYMVLRGAPMNPYIVPGGEKVKVYAKNFPPSARLQDIIKEQLKNDTTFTKEQKEVILSNLYYTFPSYFNAPLYDTLVEKNRARFLQQDYINNASRYTSNYEFTVQVVDSVPRFIPETATPQVVYNDINYVPAKGKEEKFVDENDVKVMYLPTVYRNGFCSLTSDDKVIASLTDKLRMQADFNTDDEAEDLGAQKKNWDFRYGKSSYGFWNIARVGGSVIDSVNLEEITQTRPIWMANKYNKKYNDELTNDAYLEDFTNSGKINIRIPAEEAYKLLNIKDNKNKAMNLDTMFSVTINDGHTGLTTMPVNVYVNVAPKILDLSNGTGVLPEATEDVEYNPGLIDSTRMIKIFDPNFDQDHRFELVYKNDVRNRIPIDPCFSEAGYNDISDKKTTPNWLKINPVSGLLYGKPTVNDDIVEGGTAKVTVLVWDRIKQKALKSNVLSIKDNGANVFAVGQNGLIIKINKSNSNWEFVKVAGIESFDLNDVAFSKNNGGNLGYAIGNSGIILKTVDGGSNWNLINTTYKQYNFTSIDLLDDNNIVIGGQEGKILVSADAGQNWANVKTLDATYENTSAIKKIKAIDNNTFFAIGDQGTMYKSSNKGVTMTKVAVAQETEDIKDFYVVNNTTYLLNTDRKIYRSTDAGATWVKVKEDNNIMNSIGYYEIADNSAFNNTKETVVYVTEANSRVLYSKDAGLNWYSSNTVNDNSNFRFVLDTNKNSFNADINDLVMTDENHGYIIGNDGMVARIERTVTTDQISVNGNTVTRTNVILTPVVITTKDQDMLSAMKTFTMKVNSRNHAPEITAEIKTGCISAGEKDFKDVIYLTDTDLNRPNSTEEVKLTVVEPTDNTWVLTPSVITAATPKNKYGKYEIKVSNPGPLTNTNGSYSIKLKIQASDKSGLVAVKDLSYKYSMAPDFLSVVTVTNSVGSVKRLEWGTALKNTDANPNVTTGNRQFENDGELGHLDSASYCEWEIPPVTDEKIFDARWIIPTRTGTYRNVQPRPDGGAICEMVYKATFQSGGNVTGTGTGNYVPITISWDRNVIPNATDPKNPAGKEWEIRDANSNGNIFRINMRTGVGTIMGDHNVSLQPNGIVTIQLNTVATNGFNIVYLCKDKSGAEDNSVNTGITMVAPNPVQSNTSVSFGVKESGNVTIEVYDELGNKVSSIVNAEYATGNYTINWDGRDISGSELANGTYTVRMTSGTATSTYQVKIVR